MSRKIGTPMLKGTLSGHFKTGDTHINIKTFINKFVDWFGQYNNFILSIFNWMQRKGYMEVVSKEQTIKIQEALKADLEQSQNLSKGIQR